ncbi:guanylate kinase [Companilactobacillus metriopterae]|uniref:guanylate kinase n=1 Tax=Companilactobacillus metriopterae TaxID=1909267 RepID=UPI00100A6DBE|nr:AAA family ATPase [Companilactobacillus metriopterae]
MSKKVIVITGASGTGKTTVSQYLKDKYNIPSVITHTTRKPRDGEVNGIDYYFESTNSFEENHYLERVEYSNNKYGSSIEGLNKMWESNDLISIVLDTAGAVSYYNKYKENCVVIFLDLDEEIISDRLVNRGDEERRIDLRLSSEEFKRDLFLPNELKGHAFEIKNDDFEQTTGQIDLIIESL